MTDILSGTLQALGQIGLLVHLGPGTGPLMDRLPALDLQQAVLVEADPAACQILQRRLGGDGRVRILPAAIAPQDGAAALHVFTPRRLTSLRAPQTLRLLYPGLRETEELQVATMSVTTLVGELPDPGDRPDVLVIDVPGEEETVIVGLLATGALHRFNVILLWCGTDQHYHDSACASDLWHILGTAGYRPVFADHGDPDRVGMVFWNGPARAVSAEDADRLKKLVAARQAAEDPIRVLHSAKARLEEQLAVQDAALKEAHLGLEMSVSDLRELRGRHSDALLQLDARTRLLQQIALQLTGLSQTLPQDDDTHAPAG